MVSNHTHDGSYSLNVTMFGVNVNSKVNIIINGDKIKINNEINDCKQFSDKIVVGGGNVVLYISEGDLILNMPLGKLRYIKISENNQLNSN